MTKAAVERIRGVDSDYTIRTLLHRRLIVELGRSDAPGRPFLYGTGFEFLERFGLTSLDELPPLDVDVAARLAEEGGEPLTEPMFDRGTTSPARRRPTTGPPADGRRAPPEGARGGRRRVAPGGETLIAAGRVTVDGKVATLGEQVDPSAAIIAVDGRVIGAASAPGLPAAPQAGRRDLDVARPARRRRPSSTSSRPRSSPRARRLYPVGRLDQDSEGLLILTNDGGWADRVLHPRHGVEREYAIGLRAPLTASRSTRSARHRARRGPGDADRPPPDDRDRDARGSSSSSPRRPATLVWYRAILAQGWKRQLRRMFGAVGAPIVRLVRVRIGPVRIDDLKQRHAPAPLKAARDPRASAGAAALGSKTGRRASALEMTSRDEGRRRMLSQR